MAKQLTVFLSVPPHDGSAAARAAIDEVADRWTAKGWLVLRPTRPLTSGLRPVRLSFDETMADDVVLVMRSQALVQLPGWQADRACLVDEAIARLFGKRIFDAAHPLEHPVTDHAYASGWDGRTQHQCCGKPDYAHLDGWLTFGRAA